MCKQPEERGTVTDDKCMPLENSGHCHKYYYLYSLTTIKLYKCIGFYLTANAPSDVFLTEVIATTMVSSNNLNLNCSLWLYIFNTCYFITVFSNDLSHD